MMQQPRFSGERIILVGTSMATGEAGDPVPPLWLVSMSMSLGHRDLLDKPNWCLLLATIPYYQPAYEPLAMVNHMLLRFEPITRRIMSAFLPKPTFFERDRVALPALLFLEPTGMTQKHWVVINPLQTCSQIASPIRMGYT